MMAGTSDEEMESLLYSFDQIYEDFKGGITEIQSLKSSGNAEIKRREALEIACNDLKTENERLVKIYTESLSKIVDQIERRSKCQKLIEELKQVKEENLTKEEEHKKVVELLKQEHGIEIGDLRTQIRCFQLERASNEETISQLRKKMVAHESHIDALNRRLEQVHVDVQSKHNQEIQDLKDWLLVEQKEKIELNKKLQNAENELINIQKKLEEHQRESTSNRHVETIKQRILKLRKENEVLKRQLQELRESAEMKKEDDEDNIYGR